MDIEKEGFMKNFFGTAALTGLLSLILVISCNTPKTTVAEKTVEKCASTGFVRDFSGVDGCQYLIEMEDGRKLLPSRIVDESFVLRPGMKIKFDYVEDKKYGASICMAEDMIVIIICIREADDSCINIFSADKSKWMKDLIGQKNIYRVQKFQQGDEWLYYLEGPKENYLYDCYGGLVCSMSATDTSGECKMKVDKLGRGSIIFVGEAPAND